MKAPSFWVSRTFNRKVDSTYQIYGTSLKMSIRDGQGQLFQRKVILFFPTKRHCIDTQKSPRVSVVA